MFYIYSNKNDSLINLQHYVIKEKKLSEKETLLIFLNIVKTVADLHKVSHLLFPPTYYINIYSGVVHFFEMLTNVLFLATLQLTLPSSMRYKNVCLPKFNFLFVCRVILEHIMFIHKQTNVVPYSWMLYTETWNLAIWYWTSLTTLLL